MRIIKIVHLLVAISFGLFFIYAGVKKFIPKPPKPITHNEELVSAVENNRYESPASFKLTMKSMNSSGFLMMVGFIQVLGGLLVLVPRTRLIGLLVLLPVVANIFLLHFFMDNRAGENLETGFYLLLNIILLSYYIFSHLKVLLLFEKPVFRQKN